MAGELAQTAAAFVRALDSLDIDRVMELMAEDAQGVDEISRRWIRGRSDLERYLRELATSVSEVRTELNDQSEKVWGETGLLTCWLEQRYLLDGREQHVSAPTTIVFRLEDGAWKLALFHSVPLPAA